MTDTTDKTTTPTAEAKTDELSPIENLLTQHQNENKRLKRTLLIQNVVLMAMVTVLAVGMVYLTATVKRVTNGVPQLVETATVSVESTTQEAKVLIAEIESIDFQKLASTLDQAGDSLDELDIDSLNQSIRSLNEVVGKIAKLFGGSD